MTNNKRINPYDRLLGEIKEFCSKLKYPHTKLMWRYPKEKLDNQWTLSDLWQRTSAATQLGYDVVLTATDEGLLVEYKKKIPVIPYHWEY
jgi:hypothetical protein